MCFASPVRDCAGFDFANNADHQRGNMELLGGFCFRADCKNWWVKRRAYWILLYIYNNDRYLSRQVAERGGFEPPKRLLAPNSISSRARYDLFGTSPGGKSLPEIRHLQKWFCIERRGFSRRPMGWTLLLGCGCLDNRLRIFDVLVEPGRPARPQIQESFPGSRTVVFQRVSVHRNCFPQSVERVE